MQQIILFDGVCHFCQRNVQFIIKRDRKAVFQFASLQSDIGQKLLTAYHVPADENSLILLTENHYYSKSSAALKIAQQLNFPWNLCYLFIIIPKSIRDFIYNFIANNRYRLFKQKACKIPSQSVRKRFLE